MPKSVQAALGLVPNRQDILLDFVKCYIDKIIHQSVVFLTREESSSGNKPNASLKGKNLFVHCYVDTLLNRAVKEVDNEENIDNSFSQEVDFYFIVHTQPVPSLCQKFLCENMDEINMIFHCWLFQEASCDPEETFIDQLDMGIFEPQGVIPVHQDLLDSGVEFGATSPRLASHYLKLVSTCQIHYRTVCIHGGRFSPENAQLQLLHNCDIHSFYSVAKSPGRSVVTFHVLPAHEKAEQTIKGCLSYSIGSLLHNLKEEFPDIAVVLDKFLNALLER